MSIIHSCTKGTRRKSVESCEIVSRIEAARNRNKASRKVSLADTRNARKLLARQASPEFVSFVLVGSSIPPSIDFEKICIGSIGVDDLVVHNKKF